MKTLVPLAALVALALLTTRALPALRTAQTPHPSTPPAAARATATATPVVTASATATPVFVQPGEVAPPPGSPTPAPAPAAHAAGTPEQAIRAYIALAGNWTAATVVAHYRQLAETTVGAARLYAQEMVARVPVDETYQARKPSIETELGGVIAQPDKDRETPTYLVVIRERVTTRGAAAPAQTPDWQVATAELAHQDGGWVLTRWTEPRA
jgi:hypothetical protein